MILIVFGSERALGPAHFRLRPSVHRSFCVSVSSSIRNPCWFAAAAAAAAAAAPPVCPLVYPSVFLPFKRWITVSGHKTKLNISPLAGPLRIILCLDDGGNAGFFPFRSASDARCCVRLGAAGHELSSFSFNLYLTAENFTVCFRCIKESLRSNRRLIRLRRKCRIFFRNRNTFHSAKLAAITNH